MSRRESETGATMVSGQGWWHNVSSWTLASAGEGLSAWRGLCFLPPQSPKLRLAPPYHAASRQGSPGSERSWLEHHFWGAAL